MSDASDRYERAMTNIRHGLTLAQGANTHEGRAAAAYREMVRNGEASPIKRKYSVGAHRKQVR